MPGTTRPGQSTREALIRAALARFGEKGFRATTTREIAAAAGANIGSIAYHFGGKAELHRACAEHIAKLMRNAIGDRVAQLAADPSLTPEAATERLVAIATAFSTFLASSSEAETVARFMLREMDRPTEALDLIYSSVVAPAHMGICRLWSAATGTPEDDPETLLTVFALIGQVLYFRIGREVIRRRLTWDKVGPQQSRQIAAVLADNLAAIIEYHRNKNRNGPS
jgi:TetR/AcrR family transcriptional regulator, regulator of cefoperazone and chloramphenicol sensitivity